MKNYIKRLFCLIAVVLIAAFSCPEVFAEDSVLSTEAAATTESVEDKEEDTSENSEEAKEENTEALENAITFTPSFGINSDACILYSLNQSQVIYEKNPEKKEMPAHLTNIMTAIVVLERCENIDTQIITVKTATFADDLYTYALEHGYDDLKYADIMNNDELSVKELLYAMMLTSSCEASKILEEKFSSAGKDFVTLMNEKAQEIGCTDTHFANATGLYDKEQYTTARDMLRIVKYALEVPGFEDIATAQSYQPTIRNTENHTENSWLWTNSNTMMAEKSDYYYPGSKGIKTGNLDNGGRSLIMECSRGDFNYLLILLNSPFQDGDGNLKYYHLSDAINIFDWVFDRFAMTEILKATEEVAEVEVTLSKGDDYVLVKPKASVTRLWCKDVDETVIQKNIKIYDAVHAPVSTGDKLGTIELTYNGSVIGTVDLISTSDVKRSFTKYTLYAVRNYPKSGFLTVSVLFAVGISLLYILLCIWSYAHVRTEVRPRDPVHVIPRVERGRRRRRPSKKKYKDPYSKREERNYSGRPVKMTDIRYDNEDFKH